ncbi:hypothetical protein V6N13_137401 [Hibiscus sabdariffa]
MRNSFMNMELQDWLRNNLTLSIAFAYDMENWDLMLGYVRNAFVFNNPNGAQGNIIEGARFMVDNTVVRAGAQHITAGGWLPPEHNWIKAYGNLDKFDINR